MIDAPALLGVRDVSKTFGGEPVLSEISLDVAGGQILALTGPNGAGKTTLLRCVLGLEPIDDGAVTFRGRPMDDRQPWVRAAVAAVLDDMGWFPDISAGEHLELLARAHRQADPAQVAAAAVVLASHDHELVRQVATATFDLAP